MTNPGFRWTRRVDVAATVTLGAALLIGALVFEPAKSMGANDHNALPDAGAVASATEAIAAFSDYLPGADDTCVDADTAAPIAAPTTVFVYLGICGKTGWVRSNFDLPACTSTLPHAGTEITSKVGAKFWDGPPMKNGNGQVRLGSVVATRRAGTTIQLLQWDASPPAVPFGPQVYWGKVVIPPARVAERPALR